MVHNLRFPHISFLRPKRSWKNVTCQQLKKRRQQKNLIITIVQKRTVKIRKRKKKKRNKISDAKKKEKKKSTCASLSWYVGLCPSNFKIHHILSSSLVEGLFSPTPQIVSSIIVCLFFFCFVLLILLCIYVFLSFTSVSVSVDNLFEICHVMFFFYSY